MKYKYFFFAGLIVSLISCSGSKHGHKHMAAMPGTWQATPIAIDGDSKDWPSPYPNYDAKAYIAYATSNDKENLYITMETGDELTQIKMLKQGMIVSIDTSGQKDASFLINYPLPNDNDPLEMPKGAGDPRNPQSMHIGTMLDKQIDKCVATATQYSLDGFGACNGGFMISQTSACGIKVRVRMDEYKELVWEAQVPFKALYGKDQITQADLGRPISVCFAIKGFKKESKSTDNANNGMNQTGGGGMGGGKANMGNSRGGGRTAIENPMDHLYENTRTWKIFMLSYQQ